MKKINIYATKILLSEYLFFLINMIYLFKYILQSERTLTMTALKKVMKSKTIKEAVCNLPDSFFNLISFVLSLLFMLNPLCILIKTRYFAWFPECRSTINRTVLGVGTAVLLLFVLRQVLLKKAPDIRTFVKNNVAIALFLFFALLMVLTTFVNGHTNVMVYGYSYRGEGLLGYLSYIVYFLLLALNNSDKQKKIWLYTFVGTSAVAELITVYEMYAYNSFDTRFIFSHFNHYGYYLAVSVAVNAMLIVVSSKIWEKILFSITFFLSLLALIADDTFGSPIAVLGGIIFICAVYSLAKGKFKPVTLIPMALLILTFAFAGLTSEHLSGLISSNLLQIENDTGALAHGRENAEFSTGVSRMILWENGLKFISEEPIKGHGADMTMGRMLQDSNFDTDRCHCEYMNYAICFGIPAALVYIIAVFMVYFRGLKFRKKLTDIQLIGLCSAMFYLVSAVVGNSMYYTAPFMFILLGMGYYKDEGSFTDDKTEAVSEE